MIFKSGLRGKISFPHAGTEVAQPEAASLGLRHHALVAHEYGHRADSAYLSAWGDFLHGLIDIELGELRAASSSLGRQLRRDSQGLGLGQRSYVAGLSALLDAEIAVQRVLGIEHHRGGSGRVEGGGDLVADVP